MVWGWLSHPLCTNETQFQAKPMLTKRHLAFSFLLGLSGFMLGGLMMSFVFRNLVLARCCGQNQFNQSVYNLLDHLIPYYVFFSGMFLLLLISLLLLWALEKWQLLRNQRTQ